MISSTKGTGRVYNHEIRCLATLELITVNNNIINNYIENSSSSASREFSNYDEKMESSNIWQAKIFSKYLMFLHTGIKFGIGGINEKRWYLQCRKKVFKECNRFLVKLEGNACIQIMYSSGKKSKVWHLLYFLPVQFRKEIEFSKPSDAILIQGVCNFFMT